MSMHSDLHTPISAMAGVVKIGYLKKNKSMRKRFFVLREETVCRGPASLEYYESEKKWRNNALPKKVIVLKTCFNIDKRVDSKRTLYIYTTDKCYYILFDTVKELDEWLDLILILQRVTNDFADTVKEPLEHIWHVKILGNDLGTNEKLIGNTGLCLCGKNVSIMKYPTRSKEQKTTNIELSSIRRCGAIDSKFFIELGHKSPFGSGQIWMKTFNPKVAKSIAETVILASSRNNDPTFRIRSSSFNEGTKPIDSKSKQRCSVYGSVRERCDSMPIRPRTISENLTSSTCSINTNLSLKQNFHNGCNCISACSSLSTFNDACISTHDAIDTTDGVYVSLIEHKSAIMEENQEDLVPYIPIDIEEDSMRQISAGNVNNNINLINNNIIGNRSSSSSQTGSCCDSNSPYGSPINMDDSSYNSINPPVNVFESSPPPDGYLLMKPGYTVCDDHVPIEDSVCDDYVPMKGHINSKQEVIDTPQTELTVPDGYVPMAPVNRISGYVSMDFKQGSIESGTPSTDNRFSNMHLDRVCAYLTPLKYERPTRTYSVGSKPDVYREKVKKNNTRKRANSVGNRNGIPPSKEKLISPKELSSNDSDSSLSVTCDHVEMDFSCNSKCRRLYSKTCHTLSVQTQADLSPRSSPKFCLSSDVSSTNRSTGRSPPKSIVLVDNKRLSGAVHGISRSPPTSLHGYLSPTLERVSEVPGVEFIDSYMSMKPGNCENTNEMLEESSNKNYINGWETPSSRFDFMKIFGFNWKKNKRSNSTPVQEQLKFVTHEGIDETDGYATIKPVLHAIPLRPEHNIRQPSNKMLDALQDGMADMMFSD